MLRWACGRPHRDRVRNEDSDRDSPDSFEDEGAALEVERTHPEKTTEPPRKVAPRLRRTEKALERSVKETMEGRHQEGSLRRNGRRLS